MAPHFPIGIYAIPEISMVGAPEHELTAKKIPYETGVARYREIARGQILGDHERHVQDAVPPRGPPAARHPLHRHRGHRADPRRARPCSASAAASTTSCSTVFNYPTLAECYKVAALDASNKLVLSRGAHRGHPRRAQPRHHLSLRPARRSVAADRAPAAGAALPHADPVLLAARHARAALRQLAAGSAGQLPGAPRFPNASGSSRVEVDLVAEMAVYNPFDFFLEPHAERFPFAYEPWQAQELQPVSAHASR